MLLTICQDLVTGVKQNNPEKLQIALSALTENLDVFQQTLKG